jgi:hypothetical protein
VVDQLAERAAISPVTARRWLSGRQPAPDSVAHILEQMAALAETLAHKPTEECPPMPMPLEIPRDRRRDPVQTRACVGLVAELSELAHKLIEDLARDPARGQTTRSYYAGPPDG